MAGLPASGIPEPLRALNILDSVSDAVASFDREWLITYANKAATLMARQPQERLVGGCFWDFFPELRGTVAEESLVRTMNEGVHTRYEHFYEPFDLWAEVDAYPTPAGAAIFVRDISLRKKTDAEKDGLYAALKLSDERFRIALKNSPVVVFNQDLNLVYTWVYNPLGEYRDIDWVGRSDDHLGDAGKPLFELKRSVIRTGKGTRREISLEVGGELHHWDFHLEPLRDRAGNVIGLTGAATDITARKRSEEQIARQQTQLRSIIDGMPGLVSYVDPDYRYKFVNAGYADWMGRPVRDIEGRRLEEVLAPKAFEGLLPWLRRALSGETVTFEGRFDYPDRARDIRASYVPQWANGEVEGLVVLVQDISDQKRTERARIESESQFRRIVEIATEGIWIVDPQGRTTFVNRRMGDLLGYEPKDLLGRHYFEFLHSEDSERGRQGFTHPLEGDTGPREYRAVHRSGAIVWLDFTATTVRDDSGGATGVLAMCTDITERKLAREQLQQAQKLESLGVLAGGIAHDFNNLLVGIIGNASLAQDMLSPSSPVHPVVGNVIKAGEKAAQLTHQMLAYSGKGRFIVEPVDLSLTVEEILPLISRPIPASVEVRLDMGRDLPPIEADKAQLQQVLMNLVINGAEACGAEAGTLTVSTSVELLDYGSIQPLFGLPPADSGAYVCLQVRDTGCGMTEAVRAKIFDPFFTTKFTGRGLGLSAVLGIIRAHKGALEVQSAPGKGTTFRVYFPAAHGQTVDPGDIDGAVSEEPGCGTILVVDDEDLVLRMVQPALERNGYEVLLAKDGADAVTLFARMAPRIAAVLLDLTMPHMDGEAALTRMREIDPNARIVLSSGFDESEVAERFNGKGLAGFLQKPYTSAQLLQTLKRALPPNPRKA